jgi:glutamine synthetase
MKTAKDVLKSIKDNDVKYVDLRFTDPRGKWQHVTFDVGMIEEDTFAGLVAMRLPTESELAAVEFDEVADDEQPSPSAKKSRKSKARKDKAAKRG